MCSFVLLVLLYSSFYGSCAGEPEIKIYVKKNSDESITCPSHEILSPKLTIDKTFQLYVYSDVTVQNGTCYSTESKTVYIKSLRKESNYYIPTEKLKLTKSWTKAITCELFITTCAKSIKCNKMIGDKYYYGTKCNFNLDIRLPGMGYLTVNEEKKPTTPATEADHFDNSAVYSFFESEPVVIACYVAVNLTYAQLLLTNENKTFATKDERHYTTAPAKMYAKMTAYEDGSYVDCVLKTTMQTRSFISRIYFNIKNSKPALGFQVNGLTLPAVKWPECNGKYCYKYEYYYGEELNIHSLKDEQFYGDIHCTTETPPGLSPPEKFFSTTKRQSSIGVSTFFEEYKHKSLFLHCFAKNLHENSEQKITLLLIPKTAAGRLIQGLSMANISIMITSTTLDTIYYDYDDKPLLLSCHSQTPSPRWEYKSTEVEKSNNVTAKVSYAASLDELVTRGLFKLKDEQESSVISCISPNSVTRNNKPSDKTTEVTIRRQKKNNAALEATDRVLTSISLEATTAVIPEPRPNKIIDKKYLIIIASTAILVLIVVVACFIIILAKRKLQKPKQDPTDITYENLPEHKEGVMPAPSQWNEAQYAAPTDSVTNSDYAQPYVNRAVEEMYSQPISKDQRGYEDAAYASVGAINATYAQAVPKSKRIGQGVQVLPTTGNLVYAKLKTNPKKSKDKDKSAELNRENPYASVMYSGSPYASVTPSESPYAEVSQRESPNATVAHSESPYAEVSQRESPYASVTPSESPYAEPECTKEYGNVFDGERYVNADSTGHYAEPAYCSFDL